MRFGADLNAYTSFDETVYQLRSRPTTPELLDKGSTSSRDWAGDVTFDPAEVEKERGVVLEEWRLGRGARRAHRTTSSCRCFPGLALRRAPADRQARDHQERQRDTLQRFYRTGTAPI